jgi:hypothetical protein
MKNFIKRANLKLIKWLLPWIASVITALPYSDQRSRFLDRLLVIAEG